MVHRNNVRPDGVTPYRMVGIPDGLGLFDNGGVGHVARVWRYSIFEDTLTLVGRECFDLFPVAGSFHRLRRQSGQVGVAEDHGGGELHAVNLMDLNWLNYGFTLELDEAAGRRPAW